MFFKVIKEPAGHINKSPLYPVTLRLFVIVIVFEPLWIKNRHECSKYKSTNVVVVACEIRNNEA